MRLNNEVEVVQLLRLQIYKCKMIKQLMCRIALGGAATRKNDESIG
jgi:hypothetical protein